MAVVGEILKRKKTTAAELPEEVIREEILTRLPIKSVVRFKSVAKSWLSLFSNPQFVKDHLARSATLNPNDYDCIIAKKYTTIVILSRYKEISVLPPHRFCLVGSVQGLVCLSHANKLSLWNPAIYQSKEFTFPPRPGCVPSNIGLGFDPLSNDYKVVVCYECIMSASVYSSNSDSWIDIAIPHYMFTGDRLLSSVTLNNCPYWTFFKTLSDSPFIALFAVKFDAGNNKFKLLPKFYSDTSVGQKCHNFVNMKDRLTLMVYDLNSSNCMVDIFALDGEEGCCVWSKMYSVGPLKFRTQWYVILSQGFKDSIEMVYHYNGMFFCYDFETNTTTHLHGRISTTFNIINSFRYTPSLVFLQGMKSLHLQIQTRTPRQYRTPRPLISSLRGGAYA